MGSINLQRVKELQLIMETQSMCQFHIATLGLHTLHVMSAGVCVCVCGCQQALDATSASELLCMIG